MTERMAAKIRKFIDIGANLCDGMYQGIYHGSHKHEPDISDVLVRAEAAGLEKIIVTGTSLQESKVALEMAKGNSMLYSTAGCHPTRCGEFMSSGTSPDKYLTDLLAVIQEGQGGGEQQRRVVVAVGECGLDYARTKFCEPNTQRKYFKEQLTLAEASGLPLFLHCRDAAQDLVDILSPWRDRVVGGVVHSFDGSLQEMRSMLDLDLFIGINGCSLKTTENLAVAAAVPLSRLMLETDSPWCEVKPTHAGHHHVTTYFGDAKKKEKWTRGCRVKGRNEPDAIVQVLEVLAGVREEDADTIAQAAHDNATALFFPHELKTKCRN